MESPFILILFGATGDLAFHKLIPALFDLFQNNLLPKDFYIVGFARRLLTNIEFADLFTDQNTQRKWSEFRKHISYQSGTFEDKKGYLNLIKSLKAIDHKHHACITRIFYLATPPDNYETILQNLTITKLSEGCGQGSAQWTRIAIEKPFGKDVETAKALDQKLAEIFEERQIFRVDHYLGKETIQNMLVFRFANSIFEPVWNNKYIDHVQITFAEVKGIEGRGKFFDGVGILRDVMQNHMMQILASIIMEMPRSFNREDIRQERAKAIQSIICLKPKEVTSSVIRGQYTGYHREKNVSSSSLTETFVAMKFFVNSPRFHSVPFYLRAGKKMKKNSVEISIIFKQTCHLLFKEVGCPEEGNVLTIKIQPNEGIYFKIITKTPGTTLALQPASMHFSYVEQFGTQGADAYQKLLLDIIKGDQTLFNRSDELQSSWQFITNIIKGWDAEKTPIYSYQPNSWGPEQAENLIEKDGRKWI